jgi:succinyl-CoA synthetase alpha subunit
VSILFDKSSRVLVAGLTGREARYHTPRIVASGTHVVAGVTPGKGGQVVDDIPVFDTIAQAKEQTGANVAAIFVPPLGAAESIMEAAEAGIPLIICLTELVPVLDMTRVIAFLKEHPARLIGPNCPGLATPGAGKVGFMPYQTMMEGNIGFVSRSGTLTYETVALLTQAHLGQSSCVGIGGDPIIGTSFVDILRLFEADPQTEAVVMCGEIGGSDEEDAAAYAATMSKPVVSFISGRTAPPGKRMGHAGAIISGKTGSAQGKVEALQAAGIPVAETIFEIPDLVKQALKR